MDKSSLEELDRTESGYKKAYVDLQAYDGRTLKGFVYTGKPPEGNPLPTQRYMGVIIKVILLRNFSMGFFHIGSFKSCNNKICSCCLITAPI